MPETIRIDLTRDELVVLIYTAGRHGLTAIAKVIGESERDVALLRETALLKLRAALP